MQTGEKKNRRKEGRERMKEGGKEEAKEGGREDHTLIFLIYTHLDFHLNTWDNKFQNNVSYELFHL
jgi:hypothetical protein